MSRAPRASQGALEVELGVTAQAPPWKVGAAELPPAPGATQGTEPAEDTRLRAKSEIAWIKELVPSLLVNGLAILVV